MRFNRRLTATLMGMALLAGACGSSANTETVAGSAVNDALTGNAQALDGSTVDLAAFRNSDLVVWFWAPW